MSKILSEETSEDPQGKKPEKDPSIIAANPTKDFFITMLVRDIPIINAIADLADNCVDGARRLRPDNKFTGLAIEIEVTSAAFKIKDNCGGIPVDIARDYAFRFGRPSGMEATSHAIGQFGVGMKRALFRLGRQFQIKSTASRSNFSMVVDVDAWKAGDNWEFRFAEYYEKLAHEEDTPASECGTTIEVTRLHEAISTQFGLKSFVTDLITELQPMHHQSLEDGLELSVNRHSLNFVPPLLLQSAEIQPAYELITNEKVDQKPVFIRIYAGVSRSHPLEAGWYVICNGRMVLEANRTAITGWGDNVPKYHNQFAEFRGYVYFDSQDAERLPWTTTKNGVDSDSPIYRAVRLRMIALMRPVIDFLNRLDAEIGSEADLKPLTEAFEAAQSVRLAALEIPGPFKSPTPRSTITPTTVRIQYSRPVDDVRRVQRALGVSTNKEVGEKTFEYYLEMEDPE